MPALFWAWTYVQPHYSALAAHGTNLLLAMEEAGERVTRLAPAGAVIAVWSTLRDDGQPAHGYSAEILHFYIVLCAALVLAFPEPRGWRRWRLLAITVGLLIVFHAVALLVTVEHTYAVKIEDVSKRNYTPADRAVYEWLYQTFDYFAVQLVPAVTLVLLFLRYGGLFGRREEDAGGRPPAGEGSAPPPRPRRWPRRLAAGAAVLLAVAAGLAGWRHMEKVRARQSEALCARAYKMIGTGAVDEAVNLFRESVSRKPLFLEAHDGLGHALLKAHDPALAESAFREALRIDPAYLPSLVGLANALLMIGRVDEAIEAYGRARDSDPNRWEPHYDLAQAMVRAGRLAEAEPELWRTVELNPSMPAARFDLARLLMRRGRECEALPHLEAFIEMEPESRHAELVRQTIEYARGTCGGRGEAAGGAAPRP